MLHNRKPFTSFLLLTLLGLLCLKIKADPVYLYNNCTNTNTFAPNSLYQTNLNHLLSSLSSNSTTNEFSTVTTGRGSSAVYGLFLCRGDVGPKVCRDCVTFAVKDIVKKCPGGKEAIIWYDECFLRFSNRSFFGTVDELPRVALYNTGNVTENVTEQTRFNPTLLANMYEMTAEFMKSGVGEKKYATKDANFTAFQRLYTLAQCTPDLSGDNCSRCIQDAVERFPIFCIGKQGGRQLFASCSVRYELYPFYNQTTPSPSPSLSPVPITKGKSKIKSTTIVAIVVPIVVAAVLFMLGYCYLVKRSKKKYNSFKEENGNDIAIAESLQFDFATIESATNKFSIDNKLGEGGFGEVYKGTLSDGQEIAIKRLLKSSGQGDEEFKNEVLVVAKLQHRNIVRLLGFCLKGKEKLLVYEYVPNNSLDTILYDPEKQVQLDWSRRFKIIGEIACGIVYLHEDSRLRIIHRDLKASNILLDIEMNPKISDFGMARIFGADQTRGNTIKIVGTYGYMAPEYVMYGQFSVKSDIYSFGVLILEIISGKKNNSFYGSEYAKNLLSYTWKLWRLGKSLELLDPILMDSYSEKEVIRCIHLGLLCVQEDPEDRPTMKSIIMMLNNYSVTLPLPQQPAFYVPSRTEKDIPREFDNFANSKMFVSINEVSISEFHPR